MFSQGYYLPFSPAFHLVPFQGALPSTTPGETAVVVPATATEKKKNRWSETEEKILIEVYGENEERLCISQFQQCPFSPPPPGNSGAFSRTFHPGDRKH